MTLEKNHEEKKRPNPRHLTIYYLKKMKSKNHPLLVNHTKVQNKRKEIRRSPIPKAKSNSRFILNMALKDQDSFRWIYQGVEDACG